MHDYISFGSAFVLELSVPPYRTTRKIGFLGSDLGA